MTRQITRHSRAIYGVPNGIQVTDEGIWVVDQLTDRLALIENTEPNVWGVAKIIREIATDSSTTSGIAWGEDPTDDYFFYPYLTGILSKLPVGLANAYGGELVYFQMMASYRPDRGAGGPHDSALDAADARAEL